MSNKPGDITQMLAAFSGGDRDALDALLPLVYDELRRLASNYLERERSDHTLQPTALVHEAYLRLIDQRSVDWQNRAQFFGLAANMMRRILVNHALARRTAKRGGGAKKVPLDDGSIAIKDINLDLIALNEALETLERIDPEKVRIVEMKFFAEMTNKEVAEVMQRSTSTVEREWAFARGWLYQRLSE
ncbi:MAG: sigma-70 family RNA polymerase sigma factor [Pyrinomonadaceae bacterium]|nr:sigma-70 family RNA polymerase sigma factor [Pyrinomonadaceae bacterium]